MHGSSIMKGNYLAFIYNLLKHVRRAAFKNPTWRRVSSCCMGSWNYSFDTSSLAKEKQNESESMVSRQGAAVLFSCTFSPLGFFAEQSYNRTAPRSNRNSCHTFDFQEKEVNFKHVSRQERRHGFLGSDWEVWGFDWFGLLRFGFSAVVCLDQD